MRLAQRLLLGQAIGGGSWAPSEISDIVLFDILDTAHITLINGKISAWADMYGLGVVATQGTDSARPAMGTNELIFDGGDYLTIASSTGLSWIKALHSTGGMIIALVKFGANSNPGAAYALCGNNGTSSSKIGFALYYDDRAASDSSNDAMSFNITNGTTRVAAYYDGITTKNAAYNNIIAANSYHLLDSILDADNSTYSQRFILSVDGGADIAANNQTGVKATSNASYDLQIGAGGNNALLLNGALKSLAFIPSIIAPADRQKLVGWMAHRHSELGLLPIDHPYKTSAP